MRIEKTDFAGVLGRVKSGVRQGFERFDLEGGKGLEGSAATEEVEMRLEYFTKKVSYIVATDEQKKLMCRDRLFQRY